MQHFTRFQLTACSRVPQRQLDFLFGVSSAFYRNSSISCYCVMFCKRTLCWVCPLSSQKRSFFVSSSDLDCGAEFFWRRFGLLSKFFDLLSLPLLRQKDTLAAKLIATQKVKNMQPSKCNFKVMRSRCDFFPITHAGLPCVPSFWFSNLGLIQKCLDCSADQLSTNYGPHTVKSNVSGSSRHFPTSLSIAVSLQGGELDPFT